MRTPRPVPDALRGRAFHLNEAAELGLSARMLQHPRFTEEFPRVYRETATVLDDAGIIEAARLSLPPDARLSHVTAFRRLGLEYGLLEPLHFTIGRELHLAFERIFLHRTVLMPPHDDVAVSVEAAFIGACSHLRLIDLIKIGDWLLHRGHLDVRRLLRLAHDEDWRPGSAGAEVVVPHLNGRSRSLKESEVRAVLVFGGLPVPEVNVDVHDGTSFLGCVDLLYRLWKVIVEFEGRQHAFDTAQFNHDIHRYAGFRGGGWEYKQVTTEVLNHPKALVLDVYRILRARGYDGPPPVFGRRWRSLFESPSPRAVWIPPNAASDGRISTADGSQAAFG
jgi:hypothetical protein